MSEQEINKLTQRINDLELALAGLYLFCINKLDTPIDIESFEEKEGVSWDDFAANVSKKSLQILERSTANLRK